MNIYLEHSRCNTTSEIAITGSKSETNRLLLLQSLFPAIFLENASNSDDSEVMSKALNSQEQTIDIHHAGTAMRFLTAYFAINDGRTVILTGSQRMKERPIKILVEALQQLGAQISYEEKPGYPPVKITGKKITKNKVSISTEVSSQYISALLLIAPKLENGLELTLEGKSTSFPYIKMTLALLSRIGVETFFVDHKITVKPLLTPNSKLITVESDWSSASYFYSIIALSEIGTQIKLSSYTQNSLQGDAQLAEIYKSFGVQTTFHHTSMVLKKVQNHKLSDIRIDLNTSPDIAQTIAVTCFGLGISCHLSGLHTLKIKETDRLEALKTELEKLGGQVTITEESLRLEQSQTLYPDIQIATYNDHRMAMAFAPLALKIPMIIENAEVVSKSYPDFWKNLKDIGFKMQKI